MIPISSKQISIGLTFLTLALVSVVLCDTSTAKPGPTPTSSSSPAPPLTSSSKANANVDTGCNLSKASDMEKNLLVRVNSLKGEKYVIFHFRYYLPVLQTLVLANRKRNTNI
jgi:hypothetical protein